MINPKVLDQNRAEILGFIISKGREASNLDVEDFFHDHGSSKRRRLPELAAGGFLRKKRDSDGKLVKKRQEGTLREIWEVVPEDEREAEAERWNNGRKKK